MRRDATTATMSGVALIAVCFLASAAMRLGEVGAAFAQDAGTASPAAAAGAAPDPEGLLAAIRQREEQLARDAERLTERAQTLAVAEARLAEQIEAFEQAKADLEATIALADGAAERDLAQMTAIYEKMRPQEAAGIVSRMDLAFAAGLIARMKPELAAGILTAMEADTAYAITVMAASRNARAPTQ